MTRHESINYVHLRAEECGLGSDHLVLIKKQLNTLEEKELDNLKRISEPAFRIWCNQLK